MKRTLPFLLVLVLALTVSVGAGEERPLDGDVTLRIRLVDAEVGTPLADLRLERVCCREDSEDFKEVEVEGLRTDAQGYVEIPGFHSHRIRVLVEADGRAPMLTWHEIQRPPTKAGVVEVKVALYRARSLEGRVTGPEGIDLRETVVFVDMEGFEPREIPVLSDGAFHLAGLRPDRVLVSAHGVGPAGPLLALGEGVAGGEPLQLALRVPRRGERVLFRVNIVGPTRRPTGAELRVRMGGRVWDQDVRAGRAHFLAPFGTEAHIDLEAYGAPSTGLGGVLRHGLRVEDSPVTVVRPLERILRGTLLGLDGKPASDVDVVLRPVGSFAWRHHAKMRTGAKGAFQLTGLGAMCYRVAFKWASGPTIVPSVVDGETTHLRRNLGAEPQVEVRVLVGDGEDLAPAPGIPVVIEATEGTSETVGDALPVLARTDAEGRTRFLGLDPTGRYRLKVDGKEEREAWKPEDTIVRRAPDEALAGLGFRLLSLTLRVKGARRADEGKPVLWRWGKGGVRSTAVDGDGRASVWYDEEEAAEPLELWIPGLHGGKYVHALGLRASEEQIQVEAKQGETIRGRIDAPEGLSAAAPTAFLMGPLIMVSIDPEGWPGTIPVEIDFETGRFEILGVPPGTWTIHVWGRLQGEAASWEVEAKAGDEDVVIRLVAETAAQDD